MLNGKRNRAHVLPIASYTELEIKASNAKVVRSPRLAGIGVATLSGFILNCLDKMITRTMIIPRTKLAMEAVTTLLVLIIRRTEMELEISITFYSIG